MTFVGSRSNPKIPHSNRVDLSGYMFDVGQVPLLTREDEHEIGRAIESAEDAILEALMSTPHAVEELDRVRDLLDRAQLSLAAVTRIPFENESEALELRRQTLQLLQQVTSCSGARRCRGDERRPSDPTILANVRRLRPAEPLVAAMIERLVTACGPPARATSMARSEDARM